MKKLILTIALISSVFTLTACGQSQSEAAKKEKEPPEAARVHFKAVPITPDSAYHNPKF